jgi:hypothetical protein
MKTAKEIIEKVTQHPFEYLERNFITIKDALSAMEEYAAQFKQIDSTPDLDCGIYEEKTVSPYEGRTTLRPESPLNIKPAELTDEEIIDYALNYISHKDLKPANKGLIKDALIIGAKWYRNQIEVLIMNELVKFLKWFRGHEDLNELVVEDYLKPKNQ